MITDYENITRRIIDSWLDEGFKLSELIEEQIRLIQIDDYEEAAKIAENKGMKDIARELRLLKPRKFIVKE